MADQKSNVESLQLELLPLEQPENVDEDSIEARFVAFHRANEHVFKALYALAKALFADGWKHAGMKALFERLRWLHALKTKGDKYKLCNEYTAFYSRAIMAYDAELEGFFETRSMRGRDEYEPDLERLGLTRGGYDVGPKRDQAAKARQVADAAKSNNPTITINVESDRAECNAGDLGDGRRPGAGAAGVTVNNSPSSALVDSASRVLGGKFRKDFEAVTARRARERKLEQ